MVIVTGYGSPGNEARAEAAGVSSFLRKPLSPEMIEGSAAKALSEQNASAQSGAAAATQPAAIPAEVRARSLVRIVKNVALFFAAPFVGLAYILAFPIVGLGMLAWTAIQAQQKKSAEAANLQVVAESSVLKSTAVFLAAPFIGLVYIIVGPIVGLGVLLWFGLQAWANSARRPWLSAPIRNSGTSRVSVRQMPGGIPLPGNFLYDQAQREKTNAWQAPTV